MGRTVLMIEDEPHITEAVRFLLTREGWRVETHVRGEDAVEMVQQTTPDLVILDMMLPGRSGLDILRDIRADRHLCNLPVLMLTARGQQRDRDQAEEAGVNRYMTKPFSNEEVLDAVRDLVSLASSR